MVLSVIHKMICYSNISNITPLQSHNIYIYIYRQFPISATNTKKKSYLQICKIGISEYTNKPHSANWYLTTHNHRSEVSTDDHERMYICTLITN